MIRCALLFFLCTMSMGKDYHPELQNLAQDFFAWRAYQQPSASDDIPRLERPADWVPQFSAAKLTDYNKALNDYRMRLAAIDRKQLSRTDQVDFLLMHSAIERVNWELNVLRVPHRDPNFYVHQTLGALYELLLVQAPFDAQCMAQLTRIIASFPKTLGHARENLTHPVRPFARVALGNLKGVSLEKVVSAIEAHADVTEMRPAAVEAQRALASYETWLESKLDTMTTQFALGRDAYVYFLKNVALIDATPEELLLIGRTAFHRSIAFEGYEKTRNHGVPEIPLFPDAKTQIKEQARREEEVRTFLEAKNVMTVPSWLQHYLNAPLPDYLAPLTHMGVLDDLTSPSRLHQNSYRYIVEPHDKLGFFSKSIAKDPRPIIVHEGVPGHYYQLARSWKHPNPIRRHYFDSGANEGIGFYVEEMLHQMGLFDDEPKTRETIYTFMRLRALRVEVDIRLALGEMTIEEAGKYLAEAVPMDQGTAEHEAAFFASLPGQAITYQIGKTQILEFLAKARLKLGEAFNLRAFHDYLMLNGNVPIDLQRWEFLEESTPLPFFGSDAQ